MPQTGNQNKSLSRLNRDYAPGQRGAILAAVKQAIRQYRAEHPLPPSRSHD
ncbi:MAG: hypothetical protein AB1801_12470 [Chloroflexota bacterium]